MQENNMINAQELKQLIAQQVDLVIIDVREDWERAVSQIENSIHIPLGSLADNIPAISKDKLIITYCAHGMRSQTASAILMQAGFQNVKSLLGGLAAYGE